MSLGTKASSNFFKKLISYIIYFFIGLAACFFAFVLAVNFLSPAVSEEQADQISQKEKVTAKKVFKDMFKNAKQILKESFSENKQETSSPVEEASQPLKQPEVTESPEGGGDSSEDFPEAPKDFEGEAYGNTIPPPDPGVAQPNQGTVQPVDDQNIVQPVGDQNIVQPVDDQNVVQPVDDQDINQPGDNQGMVQTVEEPSEASIEVQSYMAPFIYDSVQQKDPFEDPTVDKSEGVVVVPKTPPEKYDFSEIKFNGVIWNKEKPELARALVKLPNDEGFYHLRPGDRIGKNGVISAIRESEVVVVETSYIGSGENRKEKRVVKIKKMDRVGLNK